MQTMNLHGEPIERKSTITITTEEYGRLIFAADHLAICRDVITSKGIKYDSDRFQVLKVILGIEEQEATNE